MKKKRYPRMTKEECDAEIQYFTEQLELLETTGTNDILSQQLAKLDTSVAEHEKRQRLRLQALLTGHDRLADCRLQGLATQVRVSFYSNEYDDAIFSIDPMIVCVLCVTVDTRQRTHSKDSFGRARAMY